MKRNSFVLASLLVVFVAVFVLRAVRPVPKVRAQPPTCSTSSLTGSLGLWAPGSTGGNGWDLSMLVTFDGSGTFTGSHVYAVRGGAAVPGSGASFSNGTYSVDADCKFTAKSNDLEVFGNHDVNLEGIVVRGGYEVVGTWYSSDGPAGTFHAENVTSY